MAQKTEPVAPAGHGKSQSAPTISVPKGGGAVRGIGEKFSANPATGTGSLTVPIITSAGRAGFGPQLSLSYDSGAGNGPFGLGWSLSLPAITRKTDKGLPEYLDVDESDVFILSGAEDLVPVKVDTRGQWSIKQYRPRTEGLFSRIERWTDEQTGETHWRSITRDNITTLYGTDGKSRIFDPAHPFRVFSWLISESYDDKGNAMLYVYEEENSNSVEPSLACEQGRTVSSRSANRYLKRLLYGNEVSRLVDPDLAKVGRKWLFEVVFDYGDGHYEALPPAPDGRRLVSATKDPSGDWPVRLDAFSSYRAGFEVRTYRLCRRVLMFHHFKSQLGTEDYLVRSTEFSYRENPIASFITGITQSGYARRSDGTYLKRSLPQLELEYSETSIHNEVSEVDTGSLENLPVGLGGPGQQWVDLDGEGISGILTEQGEAWFYKPNLGNGRFGPLQKVAARPSLADLSSGHQQLLDLAGDGQLDLAQFTGPVPGFFERTTGQDWEQFRSFASLPNIPWDDPNLRFVDLTGDGHADILITENEVFTWYPSLAKEGFGPGKAVRQTPGEDKTPRLLFADGTESIYLADFSGDGLPDLARVRNGEVCYWPNLGYGRFGAKVVMDNSPWFDTPDQFNQKRVRLADIDGSGTTDIIYLGQGRVTIYHNQSGNSWSDPETLAGFPRIDNLSSVSALDLLGNGTTCLVWSSPLPGDSRRSMRYIDLMGGKKPHLLTAVKNNLGAETRVQYAASTKFYLEDKRAGQPWITRLSFPVHVVERVETYDRVSRSRFVTRYAYHHGYFDGIEREFRGFGMVEQRDTETFAALSNSDAFPTGDNWDAASHVPPVLTRTWFHTGVFLEGERISRMFEHEYYREPALRVTGPADAALAAKEADFAAQLLPDTVLSDGLSPEEAREACRALKGSILRQEIYAESADKSDRPYTVFERNYTIKLLQGRGQNRHAVFFVHPRETIDYQYERTDPPDPRVTHQLVLEVDQCGNVLKSASIAYGRRQKLTGLDAAGKLKPIDNPGLAQLNPDDRPKQTTDLITYNENSFINKTDKADWYRVGLPRESHTYELTGYAPGSGDRFRIDDLLDTSHTPITLRYDHERSYEDPVTGGRERRLIEYVRTIYRKNDLTDASLPGDVDSQALPFDTYKLAFTPGLLDAVYQRKRSGVTEALITGAAGLLSTDGGYVQFTGQPGWWIPSGRVFYSPGQGDTPAVELTEAVPHFYAPRRFYDPFGNPTFVDNDSFDLLLKQTRDARDNTVSAESDYRVLQPHLITDANGNQAEVAFDVLGLVVGTAVMGKVGEGLGDRLGSFAPDLTDADISAQLQAPFAHPLNVLGTATTRLLYDLSAYERTAADPQPQPAVVYTLTRETHVSDLTPGQPTKVQHALAYSDGFGREIQKKLQAEPGPLVDGGPDVGPRWVGSGWTVFDNKGNPVRKYEPFFSSTHHFEFARAAGVSPIGFYDPLGRVVATLHPNHTYEKVVFDPWRQATWDVNDTVLESDPRHDTAVGDFFERLLGTAAYESWHDAHQRLGGDERSAAIRAEVAVGTPTVACFDVLGRTLLTIACNRKQAGGADEFYETRKNLDIEGNLREVSDAAGRIVMRYDYDMLGNRIHQASMEAGERWILNDAAGKPIYTWDSRGHTVHTVYDKLRRPTEVYLTNAGGAPALVQRTAYGEDQSNPQTNNLCGKVYQVSDGAGIATSIAYDFKGNLLLSKRQLLSRYRATPDWSLSPPLESESFIGQTRYDALNRAIQQISPHSDKGGAKINVVQPTFNEANMLERVDAWLGLSTGPSGLLDTSTASLHAVTDIDYNARGQRTAIDYGVKDAAGSPLKLHTGYTYDPQTFRLAHLVTTRLDYFPATERKVQDLTYTYDPAGNITHIRDDAQATVYFSGQIVNASNDFIYDALNRLITADGREHQGQALQPQTNWDDGFRVRLAHPHNGQELRRYSEEYFYDEVGNIEQLVHHLGNLPGAGQTFGAVEWRRACTYDEPSLLEPARKSNRLTTATANGTTDTFSTNQDGYDEHGNMRHMPHLPAMQWDYKDQLQATAQQVLIGGIPETTYYVYDASGQRVRKVTDHSLSAADLAAGKEPVRMKERVYLGGFEVYREMDATGTAPALQRETLHITDDKQRIALVDTHTVGVEPSPPQLIRYQLGNHLSSATLELDDTAHVISYEEYYPYGATSYHGVRNQTDPPKRYRYTARERDEESGLYYHGARYYAPWLGRWASCDPIGIQASVNLFEYAKNAPLTYTDTTGHAPDFLKQVAQGLRKMDALADKVNTEKSTAEYVLTATGGQLNKPQGPFLGSGGPQASVAPGDTVFAHTHPSGAMTNMSDYNTTVQQGIDAGPFKRSVISRGGGSVSVLEIDKQSGKGTYAELNFKTGRLSGTTPIDPNAPNDVAKPLDVGKAVSGGGKVTPIKGDRNLASALLSSDPLETTMKNANALKPSLLQRASSLAGATGKTMAKSVVPGLDYVEQVGGGSIRQGAAIMSRQGVDLARQYGGQAVAGAGAAATATVAAGQAAFGATTLTGIASAGAGAVAFSAGAVVVAGAVGYGIGTALNKVLVEPLVDKLVPESVYDLSYKAFYK